MAEKIKDQSYLSIEINTISNKKYKLDINMIDSFTHIMGVNYLCDFASIRMKDFGSLISEILPLTGHETINVKYGEDEHNYNEIEFDIYSIASAPQSQTWANSNDQNTYSIVSELEIVMINRSILSLVASQPNRAFRNKRLSEVASAIADEMPNINKKIIETTVGKETVIQPYWTNGQLLRYISRYAKSEETSIGGYLYFINKDEFHFHTYEKIYSSHPVEELSMVYDSDDDINIKKSSSIGPTKNSHYGIIDIDYKINNHFYLTQGGYNSISGGYDFEKGKYINGTSGITSSKQRLTSFGNRFSVKSSNIPSVGRFLMTGDKRQNKLDISAETRHLWPFYDLVKSSILSRGKIDRRPGTIVKIVLPSTSKSREIVDSFHSGLYFVDTVSHYFKSGAYYNKIILTRSSYNSISSSDKEFLEAPVKKKIGTI